MESHRAPPLWPLLASKACHSGQTTIPQHCTVHQELVQQQLPTHTRHVFCLQGIQTCIILSMSTQPCMHSCQHEHVQDQQVDCIYTHKAHVHPIIPLHGLAGLHRQSGYAQTVFASKLAHRHKDGNSSSLTSKRPPDRHCRPSSKSHQPGWLHQPARSSLGRLALPQT